MTDTAFGAYLDRIGLDAAVLGAPADERTIARLVRAQAASIPFENLDIHRGVAVDVDPAAIEDKLVFGRRGGICYELNGLLARALRTIGFDAGLVGAAVLADRVPGPPLGHVAVVVRLDGGDVLADAGFGGDALAARVPGGAGTPAEVRFGGGSAYLTDGVLRPLSDFVAMAHWHSTSARSRFTSGIVCSLTEPTRRCTLSCPLDGPYRWTVSEGAQRTVREVDDAEVVAILAREFGIIVDGPPRPRRIGRPSPGPVAGQA